MQREASGQPAPAFPEPVEILIKPAPGSVSLGHRNTRKNTRNLETTPLFTMKISGNQSERVSSDLVERGGIACFWHHANGAIQSRCVTDRLNANAGHDRWMPVLLWLGHADLNPMHRSAGWVRMGFSCVTHQFSGAAGRYGERRLRGWVAYVLIYS